MNAGDGQGSRNPEGERWLNLMGRPDLVGGTIAYGDREVPAEDFTDLCGEHSEKARNTLRGLEATSEDDPNYHELLNMVQARFERYLSDQEQGA